MSGYAWLGVFGSAAFSTFAIAGYVVMAMPYFDNAPYLVDLKKHTRKAIMAGGMLFVLFLGLYYLAALFLNEENAGPLLLFATFIIALPVSLLLGTETWDRHNATGMNKVPGLQAVAVATGIGLAELLAFSLMFMGVMQLT